MNVRAAVAAFVGASLLYSAAAPHRARALDIASTVVSVGGAAFATVGIVMMSSGKDESAKKMGKIFMIVGLAVSGAASSSLVVLTLLIVATLDQVEAIDREAIAGGGPLTDALGSAFGVPRQEVLASVRAVHARQPLRSEADARVFADELLAELGRKAQVSDTLATTIVYDLHTERASGVFGPRHGQLAELTGVPVEAIAPTVAAALDGVLAEAVVPGAIVSARAALAKDAGGTLDALLTNLVDEHGEAVNAQIALATRAAGARVAAVAP